MTSIYFAHNPERTFPKSFPIFFFILTGISRVTTIDELSGRLLAAFFGVQRGRLTFVFCRKFLNQSVALVAVALLTINLGHLFSSRMDSLLHACARVSVAQHLLVSRRLQRESITRCCCRSWRLPWRC